MQSLLHGIETINKNKYYTGNRDSNLFWRRGCCSKPSVRYKHSCPQMEGEDGNYSERNTEMLLIVEEESK